MIKNESNQHYITQLKIRYNYHRSMFYRDVISQSQFEKRTDEICVMIKAIMMCPLRITNINIRISK